MFKSNSIIIFDWDDTLLPTTHIHNLNLLGNIIPSDFTEQLNILSNIIINLLDKALSISNVIIVTNAEYDWINYSANIFFPEIYKYLYSSNIDKISARSFYNDNLLSDYVIIDDYFENFDFYTSLNDQLLWKKITFQDYFKKNKYDNIVSIGDSECERHGLLYMNINNNPNRKSFKFVEKPSIQLLIKELEYIELNLNLIVNYNGNLDIGLTLSDIV
jgi:hypothetical protein